MLIHWIYLLTEKSEEYIQEFLICYIKRMEWSLTEMVQTVGSLFQLTKKKKNQKGEKEMDTKKEILGKEKNRVNME